MLSLHKPARRPCTQMFLLYLELARGGRKTLDIFSMHECATLMHLLFCYNTIFGGGPSALAISVLGGHKTRGDRNRCHTASVYFGGHARSLCLSDLSATSTLIGCSVQWEPLKLPFTLLERENLSATVGFGC